VLAIDHVVMAVRDLEAAAERLRQRYGLASVAGGRHRRWGTGNRIVPLGASYVELLAVLDEQVAEDTPLGRALLERTVDGDRWFALCLADDEIGSTAARLGLTVEPGSRTRTDGSEIRWRGAGIEDPRRTPDLPFFIAWETPDAHPGRMPAVHPSGAHAITRVDVAGDEAAFRAWAGERPIPVRFVEGPPGPVSVAIATSSGESLLDAR
jgi:hypothetical protein